MVTYTVNPLPTACSQLKYQYVAVICANIISICHGASVGWCSPAITLLRTPESPLPSGPITLEDASWIGSVSFLGGIFGNLFYSLASRYFGVKLSLCLLPFPNLVFWILILFAQNPYYLIVGRFLTGVTSGGMFVCLPLFVAEIASKEIRGFLGSLFMTNVCIGMLLGFLTGAYIEYSIVPYIFIVIPIVFTIGMLCFPHTPQYLLSIGKDEAAERSLRFYKVGNDQKITLSTDILQELKDLKFIATMRKDEFENKNHNLEVLLTKSSIKKILCGLCLTAISMFSGLFSVNVYSSTIYADTGANFDPKISSIISFAIQILGCNTAALTADRLGRKKLFILSSAGCAIGLFIFGGYTFLYRKGVNLVNLDWLPVTSLSFFVFSNCSGVLTLPYILLAEILPSEIRNIGSTICMVSISVFAFLNLKLFPILVEEFHLHTVFWIYGLVCTFGVLFSLFILKETKGKDLNAVTEPSDLK